jgi:hypothetical protein
MLVLGTRAQRAGERSGLGAGGRSGSREGSGSRGAGAVTGVCTGSTVIVRDGPSRDPSGCRVRGEERMTA